MQTVKKIAPITVILIFILIAYSNTFNAGLHYDDSTNIIRNKNVQVEDLNWETVKGTWFAGGQRGDIYHPVLYRPVAMFTIGMNHYLHGLDVLGYHIFNTAIHMITAVFLFLFIRRLLIVHGRHDENAAPIAFLATLLWAINPIQLTAVTYITQRMTSMAGMFYIMAMYFYLKARTENGRFYIFCGLSILLAVGSKENAIMAPLSILMVEAFFFEGLTRKKVAILLWSGLGCLLMLYAVSGTDTFSYEKLMAGYAKRDFTLEQRLLTQPRVMLFYIMLLLFPSHNFVSLTHTVSISQGLFTPMATLLSMSAIFVIMGVAVWKAKRHKLFSFAILFFFLNHLIEGTIFPLELIYEHRNYIPSFFAFLPIVLGINWIVQRGRAKIALAITACIIGFFTYNTYVQNAVWKTDFSLWWDTTHKSPDPRSMFNLAGAYYQQLKDGENALKYWRISANFNELFGANYKDDKNIIPYGRVMYMAKYNAMMLAMVKGGKVRRGWAFATDISNKGTPE